MGEIKSMEKIRVMKQLGAIHPELADLLLTLESEMVTNINRIADMERELKGRCDTCGAKLIDDCLVCGAPQCCPSCCRVATLERELANELVANRAYKQGARVRSQHPSPCPWPFHSCICGPTAEESARAEGARDEREQLKELIALINTWIAGHPCDCECGDCSRLSDWLMEHAAAIRSLTEQGDGEERDEPES